LAVRIPHLDAPPDNFGSMRQYHVQLLARHFHTEGSIDDATGRADEGETADADRANLDTVGVLEAPMIPVVSAAVFRVTGAESWWAPRLVSIVAWLTGAALLMAFVRELLRSDAAALLAGAVMLFLPFTIIISRSIQPDALMLATTIGAWRSALLAYRRPGWKPLAIAATWSAAAVLTKGWSLFMVVPVVVAIWAGEVPGSTDGVRRAIRRAIRDRRLQLLLAAAAVPGVAYYGAGLLGAGLLRGQLGGSFVASLFTTWWFWSGWITQVTSVIGLLGLTLLLAVAYRLDRSPIRTVVQAGLAGYVVSALIANYRTASHTYYALPLVALLALAVGAAGEQALSSARTRQWPTGRANAVLVCGLLAVLFATPLWPSYTSETSPHDVVLARELGDAVGHSTDVVIFTPNYGMQLRYDGRLAGVNWPLNDDLALMELNGDPVASASERLDDLRREGLRWFVSTQFPMPAEYRDVADALSRFERIPTSDGAVWDLARQP